jgi:hypothetical protein
MANVYSEKVEKLPLIPNPPSPEIPRKLRRKLKII